MRKILYSICIIIVFLISGCGVVDLDQTETGDEQRQEQQDTQGAQNNQGTVDSSIESPIDEQVEHKIEVPILYVIDGDTVKIKWNGQEESVRFLLVDTPETSHPQLGKQPFGEEAKAYVEELLAGSKTILIEKDVSERDKYGRLLMYVYTTEGKSIQESLLEEGLARVAYVYAPNTKYVDKYREIELEAKNRGVGIWSVDGYAHIGHDHGYHTEVFEEDKPKNGEENSSFEPDQNGQCSGHIKGNDSSSGDKIYHIPEGNYYNVTKAEMCFTSEKAAQEAGFRPSKS
ncbi:micrococcal nuclease [Salirhabdus euzebyi]|uniref:Micrococcal nuclease n=1 Tax=Salirhabdus euzebyi TaxID=394506 RepID=A0A841Q8K9_9BACI|nr:thermonuclease family protein [Salirhabdus euzebyi]MBB6454740.1 micrococcal nuclease [Salirhabdus euzebyi]